MSHLPQHTVDRNIDLLASEWGPVARWLENELSSKQQKEAVQLIPTEEGSLACQLIVADRASWVHRPPNPRRDALVPLHEFRAEPNGLVVVWQSGLGYLAAELRDLRREGPIRFRLIVVETRNAVFRASLQVVDYHGLLNSRSTYLFVGPESENRLIEFLKRYPWLLRSGAVVLPGSGFPNSDHELARIRGRIQVLQRDASRELESLHDRCRRHHEGTITPLTVVSAGLHPAHAERLCGAFSYYGWEVSKRLERSAVTRFIEDQDSFLDLCRQGLPDLVLCFGGKSDLALQDLRQLRQRGVKLATWFYDNPLRFPLVDEELSLLDTVFVFDRYYEAFFTERGVHRCHTLLAAAALTPPDEPPSEHFSEEISFLGQTGIERITRYARDDPSAARQVSHLSEQTTLQLLETTGEERRRRIEEMAAYDGSVRSRLRLLLLEEFLSYRMRVRFLSAIADLPLAIYGDNHWAGRQTPGSLSACFRGRGTRFPDETAELYRTSKINVNIFHVQCVDSLTTRICDTLMVGGFLLSEYRPILEQHFRIGKDLDVFRTPDELREKAQYYLKHDDERRKIAACGQETTRASATYENRIGTLLGTMKFM